MASFVWKRFEYEYLIHRIFDWMNANNVAGPQFIVDEVKRFECEQMWRENERY